MYIILCYDVQAKRTGRVLKTARKYLNSTQRSMLEGYLTPSQTARLKAEIAKVINPQEDSVRIIEAASANILGISQIGKNQDHIVGFL